MQPQTGTICISSDDLNLDHTLVPGQSFRWHRDRHGRWTAVIHRKVIRVSREHNCIKYEAYPGDSEEALVRDYFRLEVDLSRLYDEFTRVDPRMAQIIERFKGLRVLRQDPEETLLSYICSTANSIPRISRAIEALSRIYGQPVATLDGHDYYSFPTAADLAEASVNDLTELCGLGFRGINLKSVARQLAERPTGWWDSLRQATYAEARKQLLSICGVGLKIADCVLLFSLDKDEAFPVDTHIRRIAVKYYLPQFEQKTLTPKVYQQIAEYFQHKFGRYAGWAQQYLFYDDLLQHKPRERLL